MDWLHAVRGELEKQVYLQVSSCWTWKWTCCSPAPPPPTSSSRTPTRKSRGTGAGNWRGERASGDDADPGKAAGFRTHGKSKDSRDDLPQIVTGLAVTREAIPVRVWCWPGSTAVPTAQSNDNSAATSVAAVEMMSQPPPRGATPPSMRSPGQQRSVGGGWPPPRREQRLPRVRLRARCRRRAPTCGWP